MRLLSQYGVSLFCSVCSATVVVQLVLVSSARECVCKSVCACVLCVLLIICQMMAKEHKQLLLQRHKKNFKTLHITVPQSIML